MKTFNQYMAMHLGAFLFASAGTLVFGLLILNISENPGRLISFIIGCILVNTIFLITRAYNSLTIDRNAIEDKVRWESSMLRAIQLAKEADTYYDGNPNLISAFHNAVYLIEQEGITKGYLDVGNL